MKTEVSTVVGQKRQIYFRLTFALSKVACLRSLLGRKAAAAAPSICLRLDLVRCVLRNSARKDDEHYPTLYSICNSIERFPS